MKARRIVDSTGYVRTSRVTRHSACGKNAYATKKLAKTVAKAQARESGENLHAYHCYRCHCYHVGHVPGEPRRTGNEIGPGPDTTFQV